MPSPQSVLVSTALRRFVKGRAQGKLDIAYVRSWVNRLMGAWPHLNTSLVPLRHPTLRGEWVYAADDCQRVILYLHGGGYFFCSPQTHRSVTVGLSREVGAATLALDYRLAPEHPYPAALEDALSAYRWLLAQGYSPEHIAVGGDSAGGGLALALLVKLRDSGLPMPCACVCFSPWTDLAVTGSSLDENDRHCAMFSADDIRSARRLYLGDADPFHPLISPLYADLRGLPPLLIHVSDNEVLLDDSVRLAERARLAGVSVDLKVWSRQPHVWQVFARIVPEGRISIREAGQFLQQHLGAWGHGGELPFAIP